MNQPRLNLVVLRSADLERAVVFYQALGLVFVNHAHGKGPEHYASEVDGRVFEIYPLSKTTSSTAGVRLGFRVADVDESFRRAIEAGGLIVSAPAQSPWGRRAVLSDPDGHRIEITGNEITNRLNAPQVGA